MLENPPLLTQFENDEHTQGEIIGDVTDSSKLQIASPLVQFRSRFLSFGLIADYLLNYFHFIGLLVLSFKVG